MPNQLAAFLRPFKLYMLTALFLCLEMAIQVSPSVMTSELMKDLNMNRFDLGLLSSVYFYTYALMQIPAGLLLDRFNARVIIVIALLICLMGTFLFSVSSSIYILIFSRLLMGAGSAFAFISVLVVTAELFYPKHFSSMTGVTQIFACSGAMMGTVCIHELVSSYGWQRTMLLITLLGILLAVNVFFF